MDRTTLTANLKPLERRVLVKVTVDDADKRSHRLTLTPAGRALLFAAVPVWKQTHLAIDRLLTGSSPDRLRADLRALSCSDIFDDGRRSAGERVDRGVNPVRASHSFPHPRPVG